MQVVIYLPKMKQLINIKNNIRDFNNIRNWDLKSEFRYKFNFEIKQKKKKKFKRLQNN